MVRRGSPVRVRKRALMPERRRRRISSKTRGGGIGAKLGVYDDVFLCLSPGEPWLEHGIVEHRYKELCPAAYLEMIDRWGHVSQGPRRYSVTAFLTRAWSQLARDGRSEEHTSELQSRQYLVCRLLLEK